MKLATLNENEIIVTLLAVGTLLLFAYLCGKLCELLRAPKVVGEITGGILLGGTFLWRLFPDFIQKIFCAYEGEGKVLNLIYQLGLIFLMLSSGFNTDIELDKSKRKPILLIFIGATVLPMLAAIPFIYLFQPYYIGEVGNALSFAFVFMIGVAITSIPVISKIFFDMGIMNTNFSNMVLTVSTFQDLCLWILLNISTRIATTGEIKLGEMIFVVCCTLGMFVLITVLSKKIQALSNMPKLVDFLTISMIVLLLVCGSLCIAGINLMYSAFVVGYTVKIVCGQNKELRERMKVVTDFTFSLFVPVYFALVGIQIDLWHNFSFIRFLLFFTMAFLLEGIGTLIMLLFSDFRKEVRINFAVTMNTRGGPGIVLATVAYSYGIISDEFFTTLILTTMLSSLIAGYWLRYQQRKNETVFTNLTIEK